MRNHLINQMMLLATIFFGLALVTPSIPLAAGATGSVQSIDLRSRQIVVNGRDHYVHKSVGPVKLENIQIGDRVTITFDQKSTRKPVSFLRHAR